LGQGGFGTVRLAIISTEDESDKMSVDLDDIRESRLERNQKGRKVSKSIEHMSTTGTSAGGDSLG
jgi:hypothetical protein